LIIRPNGLEIIKVELEFNFQSFLFLEIDLVHVNKNSRSNYSKDEVAKIFVSIIAGTALRSVDEKEFGSDFCSYFVKTGQFESKEYRIVFCICSDRPASIGVITLYRT